MIRTVEIVLSLLIVLLLAIVVAALLPSHGHIERKIEVSSPVRQVYDTLNTLRRYPQWSTLGGFDAVSDARLEGPESGPGSRLDWSNPLQNGAGSGSIEVTSSELDDQIKLAVENSWVGKDKQYTISIDPVKAGKTLNIWIAYDVDYGWNLLWRIAGLYINGQPAAVIQDSLNHLAAMLAGFPNTDYSGQEIEMVDVAPRPLFLVNTTAARTLGDIEEATQAAVAEVNAAIAKAGLTSAGPVMTITNSWGDQNYDFAMALPVDSATVTLDGKEYAIDAPVRRGLSSGDSDDQTETATAAEPGPGGRDRNGMLIINDQVRAVMWYGGKALSSDYTGSPAALPWLRLNLKAYAETHGYHYNEDAALGRYWDELLSPADAPADAREFRVYLPVQL